MKVSELLSNYYYSIPLTFTGIKSPSIERFEFEDYQKAVDKYSEKEVGWWYICSHYEENSTVKINKKHPNEIVIGVI